MANIFIFGLVAVGMLLGPTYLWLRAFLPSLPGEDAPPPEVFRLRASFASAVSMILTAVLVLMVTSLRSGLPEIPGVLVGCGGVVAIEGFVAMAICVLDIVHRVRYRARTRQTKY